MCRSAVYPGTFDPVTYGHIDLIKRAKVLFPDLRVVVAKSILKRPLFSLLERMKMLRKATEDIEDLIIESFDGLIVDYCHRNKIRIIIRGLRMLSDFEYEFQMALTNRKLLGDIETLFLMPQETYAYLSSNLLKEIASLGGDLSAFVPPFVEKALKDKLKNK
ncbi:MAG: pantetheine-phosphate adenylyltransferase [Candidatus Omnitrophica bacterium]|nr:pantetheine-phosphate adenylyltransferase [Candidatus Omnitrophota bacterium]